MSEHSAGIWTGKYLALICSTFIAYVGFQMLIPTLTVHVTDIGGSTFSASLAYSAAAIAALGSRAIFGPLMDRIGRMPVLIAGGVLLIAANLLLFTVANIPLICLIRLFQGIGWGMTSTALATIVSDMVAGPHIGEGIGYFALSIVLATSSSVIAGVWLMNAAGFAPMLGASAGLFALAGLLWLRMGKVPFRRESPQAGQKTPLWEKLFEKRAVLPAFLCFLHSVAFSGIITFIMLFGKESGIRHVFVFFVGYVLMILVSRPIVGRIFDAKGHAVVVIPGVFAMILGLLMLSWAHGMVMLVAASLVYGAGFGSVQPSLQAWAICRSPDGRRGAANGTFLSSLDLGYAAGAILTGQIASATSYAEMYRLSPLLLVVFLLVYIPSLRREHRD